MGVRILGASGILDDRPVWRRLGISKVIMVVHGHSFSRDTYFLLDHYRTLLAGVGVGLLTLFFLSGEVVAGLRKWQQLKKGRNPNA